MYVSTRNMISYLLQEFMSLIIFELGGSSVQRPGRLERRPRGSRRPRWLVGLSKESMMFQKTKRVNSSILVLIVYMMPSSLVSKSEF